MSKHEARGTRRTCQNEECALAFYDLNRLECSCPNCGTVFSLRALAHVGSDTRKRSQSPAPVVPAAVPRGPVDPIAEEPEEAGGSEDVAEDDTDDEGVSDRILDEDVEDSNNVEVERFPGVAAED